MVDIMNLNDPNNRNNPNNPDNPNAGQWQYPDGRQFTATALQNMCMANPDGTVGYYTAGDIHEILLSMRNDSNLTMNGNNAQKLGGQLEQQGQQKTDDVFQQHQREEQQRQEEAQRQETARLLRQQEDAKLAAEKKAEQDAWNAQHRPQEDAIDMSLLRLPLMMGGLGLGMAGFGGLMRTMGELFSPYKDGLRGDMLVATNGNGDLLGGLRKALGITPQGGDMVLTGPGQTQAFTPGQTPAPTVAAATPAPMQPQQAPGMTMPM